MIVRIKEVNPSKTGKRWKNVVPEKDTLVTYLDFGNGTGYQITAFRRRGRVGNVLFLGVERVGCFSFPTK